MKNVSKALLCIALSFMFVFICVGYAQVTDIMDIQGTAQPSIQQGVFIQNTSAPDGAVVNGYVQTTLNSTVSLAANSSSTVTLNITVYNNSSVVYGYNVMKYVVGDGSFDNENIEVTTAMQKKHQDWKVEPQGTLTFPVTFSYKSGASVDNGTLNSVITFEFLPFDEIPDNVEETTVDNAMARFEEILNSTNGDYETLKTQMENTSGGDRYSSSYISNVSGASDSDKETLNQLFAGNLNVNINGEDTEVKIMLKRENVNNVYSGDEMVIYMTTDPLTTMFGKAVVYRCIYAYNGEKWIRVGEMVEGTANICDYTTGLRFGTGSFNTDSWKMS